MNKSNNKLSIHQMNCANTDSCIHGENRGTLINQDTLRN